MDVSIFDLFSIGVGPSSSHTLGPMVAGYDFANDLFHQQSFSENLTLKVHLYGSLALTGKGHATDKALLLGLSGILPEFVGENDMIEVPAHIEQSHELNLFGKMPIRFQPDEHLIFHYDQQLDFHTNGMTFTLEDAAENVVAEETYFSVGGGFIVKAKDIQQRNLLQSETEVPFSFHTAKQLLAHCEDNSQNISEIVLANERARFSENEIDQKLEKIWHVMNACIERGLRTKGILPGGLEVARRAPALHQKILTYQQADKKDNLDMAWLNLFALSVNEENAAMGQMVTAPTNGAAGILPAVLKYYLMTHEKAGFNEIKTFLLTAGGIGLLYKERASISGAEVGCQGEVGVACSMAAGALAEVMGGSVWQVEKAAEIGMEHHLGLTCDPIGGLVQIPCIERNAMAAVRAVNAAQLSLLEEPAHKISLDKVILTMKQTGKDMLSIYKETSQGGLAVNHPEC